MENNITPSRGGAGRPRGVNTGTVVGLGLLTAIVVVLQFVSMALRFSAFSITLNLVPIIVGAALYGRGVGAWLGFVFGLSVLLTGDAAGFLAINIPGTIVTVLLKGILAGLCAGVVYRLLAKKNATAAVLAASITAPVVNTGIFVLGCLVFFMDYVNSLAAGSNAFLFILTAFVGGNFFVELGVNLVLNPAILRIIRLGKNHVGK